MHKPQAQVRDFMRAMEQPVAGDRPGRIGMDGLDFGRLSLRLELIREEFTELVHASGFGLDGGNLYKAPGTGSNDPIAQIDALCDLLYVTYGMATEMGIDIEPFFEEVHRANMQKSGGPIRADGKKLKPAGWKPPNLAAVYHRVYLNATRIHTRPVGEE